MGVSQHTKLYKTSFCSTTSIALLPKLFTWKIIPNNEEKQIFTMIPFNAPCTLGTCPEYIISNYLLNFHRLFSSIVHPSITEQCHALQNGLGDLNQHFHSLTGIEQQIKTIDITTNHNGNETTLNTIIKKLEGIQDFISMSIKRLTHIENLAVELQFLSEINRLAGLDRGNDTQIALDKLSGLKSDTQIDEYYRQSKTVNRIAKKII